jgi:hypothetical protein
MWRMWRIAVMVASVGVLLGGCGHSGTSSSGVFDVVITDEDLETTAGNQCSVKGHATNTGNLRARVELTYEALNATGAVIGTSTGSFEVSPFSNFDFGNSKGNSAGQPSSTVFSNGLACSGISNFRRTRTDVTKA